MTANDGVFSPDGSPDAEFRDDQPAEKNGAMMVK